MLASSVRRRGVFRSTPSPQYKTGLVSLHELKPVTLEELLDQVHVAAMGNAERIDQKVFDSRSGRIYFHRRAAIIAEFKVVKNGD